MKRAFSLSSLLHLLVLLLFTLPFVLPGCGSGSGKKKGEGPNEKTKLTEPGIQDGFMEILSEGEVPIPDKKVGKDCKDSFGGIGVVMNLGSGMVMEAPEWNPAYKAGIRVGDIILNNEDIKGPPGTTVEVLVTRDNAHILTFNIVREIICYRTEEKESQ
jgi:hypothetical protein